MGAHRDNAPLVITRYTRAEELPEWLSLQEAATWRGVSTWIIREEIRRHRLHAVKMGKLYRISREALVGPK